MQAMDAGHSRPRRNATLFRCGREERVFEREEVLGRDATSVFPTESQAKPLDSDTVNAMLGSNLRFITESEVLAP